MMIAALCASFILGTYREMTEPAYTCDENAVFAEKGDTIWSLIEEHCEGDFFSARYFITNIYGTRIFPGQLILLEN